MLYTATPTRRFMQRCREMGVDWAIFSDKYGVWLPSEEREWYEKDPDTVTDEEFQALIRNFETRLEGYDEVLFYNNPGRFHPLYKKLLKMAKVKGKVTLITHLDDIVRG
jgi:hypothetical protein